MRGGQLSEYLQSGKLVFFAKWRKKNKETKFCEEKSKFEEGAKVKRKKRKKNIEIDMNMWREKK